MGWTRSKAAMLMRNKIVDKCVRKRGEAVRFSYADLALAFPEVRLGCLFEAKLRGELPVGVTLRTISDDLDEAIVFRVAP